MFFIDIAVPRDVDPEINRLDGIFLYDIDDLQSVTVSNLSTRTREAERAEAILEQELLRYQRRIETLDVVPTLVDLQATAEDMRQAELRRAQSRLQSLTAVQQAAVEALTRGLMNKFLHQPLQALKAAAREGDLATVDAIRAAFQMNGSREAATTPVQPAEKTSVSGEPALTTTSDDND